VTKRFASIEIEEEYTDMITESLFAISRNKYIDSKTGKDDELAAFKITVVT
jgi:hypothetical protein